MQINIKIKAIKFLLSQVNHIANNTKTNPSIKYSLILFRTMTEEMKLVVIKSLTNHLIMFESLSFLYIFLKQ
jgi:hypothetical protein